MNPPFQTGCWNSASRRKTRIWVLFRHEVPILAGCRVVGPLCTVGLSRRNSTRTSKSDILLGDPSQASLGEHTAQDSRWPEPPPSAPGSRRGSLGSPLPLPRLSSLKISLCRLGAGLRTRWIAAPPGAPQPKNIIEDRLNHPHRVPAFEPSQPAQSAVRVLPWVLMEHADDWANQIELPARGVRQPARLIRLYRSRQ